MRLNQLFIFGLSLSRVYCIYRLYRYWRQRGFASEESRHDTQSWLFGVESRVRAHVVFVIGIRTEFIIHQWRTQGQVKLCQLWRVLLSLRRVGKRLLKMKAAQRMCRSMRRIVSTDELIDGIYTGSTANASSIASVLALSSTLRWSKHTLHIVLLWLFCYSQNQNKTTSEFGVFFCFRK